MTKRFIDPLMIQEKDLRRSVLDKLKKIGLTDDALYVLGLDWELR